MIKVAILSYWHVHGVDYAQQVREHPDTELVGVWDENIERGKECAGPGVKSYQTLEELLAQPDIDAVIVTTATNQHRDVMVKAATAGKHIFTEKVLATTLKEANEIVAAVNKAGVKLIVSLPRINWGLAQLTQDLLAKKRLGQITLVRARMSHNGALDHWLPEHFYSLEQCGGGAMIDLGCHPMYLICSFLGLPESISAHYGYITGKEVEDNAVTVLKYNSGAIGIVESGFVNSHSPFSVEVHGTEGTILYGYPEDKLLLRSNLIDGATETWQLQKLPIELPATFDQWIDHIQHNTTAEANIQLALDLTKLMEASNLSADSQSVIRIADIKSF